MSIASATTITATDYAAVRARSEALVATVPPADRNAQSMPECSPVKWHLAHTSWFFDTFLLAPAGRGIADGTWRYLFNSYYVGVGPRFERARRGLRLRPDDAAVMAYRGAVDDALLGLLADPDPAVEALVALGLHHEQQHQELLLTDLKHAYGTQVLPPALDPGPLPSAPDPGPLGWRQHPGGTVAIGHAGDGFAYDNEGPRHRVLLQPFALADRLVTCGEYLAFIAEDGYRRPDLWLDDGWSACTAGGWEAPLYWRREHHDWYEYTLHGERPLDLDAPVVHVSLFEADAYARWAGARLPTEAEWETMVDASPPAAEPDHRHPTDCDRFFGACWQWTRSAYLPYPGYRPAPGAVGEYNGKFMNGQYVLRGSSIATPPGHARVTYRNFFPPPARWQFSGIRLAKDAS